MEVEDGEAVVQPREQRIVASVVSELHRCPADLAALARVHPRAQHLRDQLRAEATASSPLRGMGPLIPHRCADSQGIRELADGGPRGLLDLSTVARRPSIPNLEVHPPVTRASQRADRLDPQEYP